MTADTGLSESRHFNGGHGLRLHRRGFNCSGGGTATGRWIGRNDLNVALVLVVSQFDFIDRRGRTGKLKGVAVWDNGGFRRWLENGTRDLDNGDVR